MGLPRKPKLGQHFLIDDDARHRIADALGDVSGRTVIEIGPGHGAITSVLAPRCRRLVAIEFDPQLAAELHMHFRNHPSVEIVRADILKTDLAALLPLAETADVIGNLPYHITSEILLKLFASARSEIDPARREIDPARGKEAPVAHNALTRAVVMIQREVADRLAASPGSRDYGLLSATAQMHARVEALFTLPPMAFSPPPDVYSTVVRLDFAPRFRELQVDPAGFDAFLKVCFAQKRKTLANNLRAAGYSPDAARAAWPATIPAMARAEAVALPPLAELYRALANSSPQPRKRIPVQ